MKQQEKQAGQAGGAEGRSRGVPCGDRRMELRRITGGPYTWQPQLVRILSGKARLRHLDLCRSLGRHLGNPLNRMGSGQDGRAAVARAFCPPPYPSMAHCISSEFEMSKAAPQPQDLKTARLSSPNAQEKKT